MHELAHEFTSKRISPWGGSKFFQQTYERSGVKNDLLAAGLPKGGSNSAYNTIDLIEGFMVSVVLGARRVVHSSMLRTDSVIKEMFVRTIYALRSSEEHNLDFAGYSPGLYSIAFTLTRNLQ